MSDSCVLDTDRLHMLEHNWPEVGCPITYHLISSKTVSNTVQIVSNCYNKHVFSKMLKRALADTKLCWIGRCHTGWCHDFPCFLMGVS